MLIDWQKLESKAGNYGCGITMFKNKISSAKGYFFRNSVIINNRLFKQITELQLATPFSHSSVDDYLKVDLKTKPENSETIFDLVGESCSFVEIEKVKTLYETCAKLDFKIFLETVGFGFKKDDCDKTTFYFDNFDKVLPKDSKRIIDGILAAFGIKETRYLLPKTDNMYLYIVALEFSRNTSKIKFYFLADKCFKNDDLSSMFVDTKYAKYANEVLDTNGWIGFFQIAFVGKEDITYNFYYKKEKRV